MISLNLFQRVLRFFLGCYQSSHMGSIKPFFAKDFATIPPSDTDQYLALKKIAELLSLPLKKPTPDIPKPAQVSPKEIFTEFRLESEELRINIKGFKDESLEHGKNILAALPKLKNITLINIERFYASQLSDSERNCIRLMIDSDRNFEIENHLLQSYLNKETEANYLKQLIKTLSGATEENLLETLYLQRPWKTVIPTPKAIWIHQTVDEEKCFTFYRKMTLLNRYDVLSMVLKSDQAKFLNETFEQIQEAAGLGSFFGNYSRFEGFYDTIRQHFAHYQTVISQPNTLSKIQAKLLVPILYPYAQHVLNNHPKSYLQKQIELIVDSQFVDFTLLKLLYFMKECATSELNLEKLPMTFTIEKKSLTTFLNPDTVPTGLVNRFYALYEPDAQFDRECDDDLGYHHALFPKLSGLNSHYKNPLMMNVLWKRSLQKEDVGELLYNLCKELPFFTQWIANPYMLSLEKQLIQVCIKKQDFQLLKEIPKKLVDTIPYVDSYAPSDHQAIFSKTMKEWFLRRIEEIHQLQLLFKAKYPENKAIEREIKSHLIQNRFELFANQFWDKFFLYYSLDKKPDDVSGALSNFFQGVPHSLVLVFLQALKEKDVPRKDDYLEELKKSAPGFSCIHLKKPLGP